MPPAARKGDSTVHTTSLDGAGCGTVKIGGQNAWRVGDFHACSAKNYTPAGSPVPHVGGNVLKGSFTVLIGGQPAVRKTDIVVEPVCVPPTTPFLPNNTITGGESSVDIGDVGFGLLDPAIMRQFCAEWRQLLQDWAGLTDAERQQRMENVVNNALGAAGTPPVNGIHDSAPSSAQAVYFDRRYPSYPGMPAHSIGVPPGTFGPRPPNPGLGSVLFHEARHATQWSANARYLASQGMSASHIYMATGTSANVAMHAVANPAGPGTAVGQLGAMNNAQNYGNGAGYNGHVRNNQIQAHGSGNAAAYTDAMDMYWTLPNERDAEDAGEALRAICPDSRPSP